MDTYRSLLQPLLFTLDPEAAHRVAWLALRSSLPWRALAPLLQVRDPRLATRLGDLALSNPVGLAPGFDKDCELVDSLQCLGFGYVEVGSVLPDPRPGNDRPRLKRYPADRSLVNCMGLPSRGVDYAVAQLQRRRLRRAPVVVNINAFSLEGYLRAFAALEPLADAVEFSLLCPNVVDRSMDFMAPGPFEQLLTAVMQRRRKPVFVKLRSYAGPTQRQHRLDLAERALHLGVDGFTMSGTYSRAEPDLAIGQGNVTGALSLPKMMEFVHDLYSVTGKRAAIKALGGISSGADAFYAIAAGASAVELLTALFYQGWTVAARINRELLQLMQQNGVGSLDELRGSAAGAATRPA